MMHIGFAGMPMFLWMLLQWGLLLFGIYLVIRWIKAEKSPKTREDEALRILRERYARGEISDEEFDHRLNRLNNG
ncbi:SHOCT domain-containing protein [Ammoniphilus sp. 3BR4]|uniref:SHOCT domain-containing protein n=1 Tax=Ammoniphilus sp. 3BR4 TaxID=3158265 RepID=UPI0034672400